MKPNLSYALLLFLLLLVDKSLSARVRPSTKEIFKNVNAKKKFPPRQQNESPKQIQGLSVFKEYFVLFGYLQSSQPLNDYLDDETITAITTYQKYFNLQPTGDLSLETLQQLSLLRCGVPDMNFKYGFVDNVSLPKAGNRWFPEGDLAYGFDPVDEIDSDVKKVLRDAFARWEMATGGLRLTETTYDKADIRVGFKIFGVSRALSGMSFVTLQPGSNITKGDIQFDFDMFWVLPIETEKLSWVDRVLDLESAAMHQIGHILGLDHSNNEDSVMYPYILPSRQRKVELSDSDKDNFQRRFDNNGSYGHGGRWGVLLVTTLSLGFAYVMFLLN